jgi:hypothetical protein
MSLILLFTSKRGAIISSDKRVIDFYAFVILGNKITKREAHATIKREWSGKADMMEIEEVIKKAMENCSNKTASMSKEYDMFVSAEGVEKERVMELLREDAEKNHWNVEEVFYYF